MNNAGSNEPAILLSLTTAFALRSHNIASDKEPEIWPHWVAAHTRLRESNPHGAKVSFLMNPFIFILSLSVCLAPPVFLFKYWVCFSEMAVCDWNMADWSTELNSESENRLLPGMFEKGIIANVTGYNHLYRT